jgi:hypothetical protein
MVIDRNNVNGDCAIDLPCQVFYVRYCTVGTGI